MEEKPVYVTVGSDTIEVPLMDLREFHNFGFLQEANRKFFHPLGLALTVVYEDDDQAGPASLRIIDYRGDPEGIVFAEPCDLQKAARVQQLMKDKSAFRMKLFSRAAEEQDVLPRLEWNEGIQSLVLLINPEIIAAVNAEREASTFVLWGLRGEEKLLAGMSLEVESPFDGWAMKLKGYFTKKADLHEFSVYNGHVNLNGHWELHTLGGEQRPDEYIEARRCYSFNKLKLRGEFNLTDATLLEGSGREEPLLVHFTFFDPTGDW